MATSYCTPDGWVCGGLENEANCRAGKWTCPVGRKLRNEAKSGFAGVALGGDFGKHENEANLLVLSLRERQSTEMASSDSNVTCSVGRIWFSDRQVREGKEIEISKVCEAP